jgi:hypothetical protein
MFGSTAKEDYKDDFWPYSVGLCCASVCSAHNVEETTERLNLSHPTGISSRWQLSEDKTFKTGEPMPAQCPDHPENKHYLFNC